MNLISHFLLTLKTRKCSPPLHITHKKPVPLWVFALLLIFWSIITCMAVSKWTKEIIYTWLSVLNSINIAAHQPQTPRQNTMPLVDKIISPPPRSVCLSAYNPPSPPPHTHIDTHQLSIYGGYATCLRHRSRDRRPDIDTQEEFCGHLHAIWTWT